MKIGVYVVIQLSEYEPYNSARRDWHFSIPKVKRVVKGVFLTAEEAHAEVRRIMNERSGVFTSVGVEYVDLNTIDQ